jgi:hypothetical protein
LRIRSELIADDELHREMTRDAIRARHHPPAGTRIVADDRRRRAHPWHTPARLKVVAQT